MLKKNHFIVKERRSGQEAMDREQRQYKARSGKWEEEQLHEMQLCGKSCGTHMQMILTLVGVKVPHNN